MVQEKARGVHLGGLVQAVRRNRGKDGVGATLHDAAWTALAPYLEPKSVVAQQVVIQQGDSDRSVYFIESGMVRIYRSDRSRRLQLAVLGSGSIVGEGSFFAPVARNASAEAAETGVLWELKAERFAEMVKDTPEMACEVALALAGVLSVRTLSVAGRLAIT